MRFFMAVCIAGIFTVSAYLLVLAFQTPMSDPLLVFAACFTGYLLGGNHD